MRYPLSKPISNKLYRKGDILKKFKLKHLEEIVGYRYHIHNLDKGAIELIYCDENDNEIGQMKYDKEYEFIIIDINNKEIYDGDIICLKSGAQNEKDISFIRWGDEEDYKYDDSVSIEVIYSYGRISKTTGGFEIGKISEEFYDGITIHGDICRIDNKIIKISILGDFSFYGPEGQEFSWEYLELV